MSTYVLSNRAAIMTSGMIFAEAQGLVEVKGEADPDAAGIRLTRSGKVLALALGFDPESSNALAGVVQEAVRQFEPTAVTKLLEAEQEAARLQRELEKTQKRTRQAEARVRSQMRRR